MEESLRRAMSEQVSVHCQYFYPASKRYFDFHIYPSSSGVTLFVTDNTERKQAEEALLEADRQKDEFLAILAHELRNPLVPIQNAISIMRRLGATDPNLQWAQDVVDHQVTHMKRLLDDLLDVARISQGRMTLRQERLEVVCIINQAVEVAGPVIDERGHELIITSPPDPLYTYGDLTRLAQVMSNLLNNAAKYTLEGGHISLAVDSTNEEVVFRVRDNGIGISPDVLPHLFDSLTRGDKATRRESSGLGLGLTLVRSLVELHGGSVEAHSDGAGKGSEFVVRLPRVSETPGMEASGPADEESVQRFKAGYRILVVEDQAVVALSMAKVLEMEGFEVQTAANGPSALEISRIFLPQAVFLDIGLPGMDGYEVARRLRAQRETQHIRIIALSGYGQRQDIQRSHEAGCDDHLVKPVSVEDLVKALNANNEDLR